MIFICDLFSLWSFLSAKIIFPSFNFPLFSLLGTAKEAMEKSLKIKQESDLMRLDQQHELNIEKISKHFQDKINKLEREKDGLQNQLSK